MKRIASVVTAAGFGRRYGAERKLQATLDGRPVLEWSLATQRALPLTSWVVVIAPGDAASAALAAAEGAAIATNPDPARGLGSSIAAGVQALPAALDGILIVLGDMPRVRETTCRSLIARFEDLPGSAIVAPAHAGRRGQPVLFGLDHRAALAALDGDHGARALLTAGALTLLDVDDPGILLDIDTPADLAAARTRR